MSAQHSGAIASPMESRAHGVLERVRALSRTSEFLVLVFLLLLCVVMSFVSSNFATEFNLQNVGRQTSVLIVLCVGLLFVLLVGGIDLSVGGVIAVTAVVAARLAADLSPGEAFVVAVALATAIGVVNGVLIAVFGLSPIVVTLAMGQLLLGVALLMTHTGPIQPENLNYGQLAASSWGPVPTIVIAAIACVVVGHVLLRRFSLGRYVYAVGGNETAAWLAGVPARAVKVTAYALCGLFAGVAAVLLSSRLGSADATLGSTQMLEAYAAAFIGGVGFGTAKGSAVGVALGALILGVIANGIDLLSLNTDWQYIVSAVLIIAAIAFQKGAGLLRWRRA